MVQWRRLNNPSTCPTEHSPVGLWRYWRESIDLTQENRTEDPNEDLHAMNAQHFVWCLVEKELQEALTPTCDEDEEVRL